MQWQSKRTWTLVAHAGTVAHSHLMVSLVQAHYINQGIRENIECEADGSCEKMN